MSGSGRARSARSPRNIGIAALLAGAGVVAASIALVQARRQAAPTPAPRAAAVPEPEPDRARTREPVLPLAQEKLVPAAEGVEIRWANLNHDAITALNAGELQKAVEMFERCVDAVPNEPVFARNLAEALARLALSEVENGTEAGRAGALIHLQRAAELAPGRADIRDRLAQDRRLAESEKGFATERSDHFELSYDGSRTDLLWSSSEITRKLEAAYQDFGEQFGFWPVEGGRPRIRVVLYKRSVFHEATGMGHWAVGAFDGAVRVPVEDLGAERATLERVLRHEVAHAFIREAGGTSVPGWLNEGLAQWLEWTYVLDRGRAIDAARQRLRGQPLLPLEALQASLGENRSDEEVGLAYAEALALCGKIDTSFGERLLFELVAASRTQEGWRGVFARKTGVELETLLAELSRN